MDTCVKISGEYLALPENAALIRKVYRTFFESLGLTTDQVQSMLLAMGEMVVNSIEHAYHGTPGYIEVASCYSNNLLTITISDYGDWYTHDNNDFTRGRGIMIAEALSTQFSINHENGTQVKIVLDTSNKSLTIPQSSTII